MSKFTIELLFCHNIKINTFASLSCMSEEQPHSRPYPSWPEICDPTKKIYDPFEEYSAYDRQRSDKQEPPKDSIDRFVRQYGYFSKTTEVEVFDTVMGKWKPYRAMSSSKATQDETTEQQKPEPPRDDYGPYRPGP